MINESGGRMRNSHRHCTFLLTVSLCSLTHSLSLSCTTLIFVANGASVHARTRPCSTAMLSTPPRMRMHHCACECTTAHANGPPRIPRPCGIMVCIERHRLPASARSSRVNLYNSVRCSGRCCLLNVAGAPTNHSLTVRSLLSRLSVRFPRMFVQLSVCLPQQRQQQRRPRRLRRRRRR